MLYWNNKGKHQTELDRLIEAHLPSSGPAGTVGGEILRAVNGLYYECYNNGFCNNYSGPVKYLRKQNGTYIHSSKLSEILNILEDLVNNGVYSELPADRSDMMDVMIDEVLEFFTNDPSLFTVVTSDDMWSFSDRDRCYHGDDDGDDE